MKAGTTKAHSEPQWTHTRTTVERITAPFYPTHTHTQKHNKTHTEAISYTLTPAAKSLHNAVANPTEEQSLILYHTVTTSKTAALAVTVVGSRTSQLYLAYPFSIWHTHAILLCTRHPASTCGIPPSGCSVWPGSDLAMASRCTNVSQKNRLQSL